MNTFSPRKVLDTHYTFLIMNKCNPTMILFVNLLTTTYYSRIQPTAAAFNLQHLINYQLIRGIYIIQGKMVTMAKM